MTTRSSSSSRVSVNRSVARSIRLSRWACPARPHEVEPFICERSRGASGAAKWGRVAVLATLLLLLAPLANALRGAARADDRPRSPFAYVDVFIDPHGTPLAAYQFELRATAGDVKLVGIEGGEHAAFAKPPYYDPKALLNDRIVIAAFNTDA